MWGISQMIALSLTGTYESELLWNWAQTRLPSLNQRVLAGAISLDALLVEVNTLLAELSDPTVLSLDNCKRQLTVLGMIGSSVERHAQEAGLPVGLGLRALTTSVGSFSRYVATLAARLGVPPRDSFLSSVIWNVPTVSVYLPGESQPTYTLAGVQPEGCVPLTFSNDSSEAHFLYLLKRCAALEAAVNQELWTVLQLDLPLDTPEALRSIEMATLLLRAIRAEMLVFMHCPPLALEALRPYACAWDIAEMYSPPSAAHDPSGIVRDYLLGTLADGHDRQVAPLFHVFERETQREIESARTVLALPTRIVWQLGLETPDDLAACSSDDLRQMVSDYPWIEAYYRLYQANADLSIAHGALMARYAFVPLREEGDLAISGNGRRTAVSGLQRCIRSRRQHLLRPFKAFLPAQASNISSEQLLTLARS